MITILEDVNGSYAQQYSDVSMPSSAIVQQINSTNSKLSKDTNSASTQKGKKIYWHV